MSLMNTDSSIERSFDMLSAINVAVDLPSPRLAGRATSIFAQPSCSETDGGNVPYEHGVTTSNEEQFSDYCEADVLVEYYCDGTKMHSYSKPCMYGCVGGVCKNTPEQPVAPALKTSSAEDIDVVQAVLKPKWIAPKGTPTCENGFKDGDETDADCGGPCGACTYSKMCKVDADCMLGAVCNYRSRRCLQTKY
jgi:hypothetical protein